MGSLIIQMGKALGMGPVVGTAGSDVGVQMLREKYEGVYALNHRRDRSTSIVSSNDGEYSHDYLSAKNLSQMGLSELLPARPVTGVPCFDVIIEMRADLNLQADIDVLNRGGITISKSW